MRAMAANLGPHDTRGPSAGRGASSIIFRASCISIPRTACLTTLFTALLLQATLDGPPPPATPYASASGGLQTILDCPTRSTLSVFPTTPAKRTVTLL